MHIKLLTTILCASLATAPLVSGANANIEVWVVSDSVRVDPVGNKAFEDNQNLFPDGIRPGYKNSNVVWDGTARRIILKAARNSLGALGMWMHDPDEWERVRLKIGEAIEKKSKSSYRVTLTRRGKRRLLSVTRTWCPDG
jgi:hypothetical protein